MSRKARFGFPLLIFFFIATFLVPVLKVESTSQQSEAKSSITYFNMTFRLVSLDLVARRVNFSLSGTLGFNFNATSDRYLVMVATMGSDIGQTKIRKIDKGGINASVFQMYANESSFSGYFWGGPETYPFDRYKFNVTLSFLLQGVLLSSGAVDFSWMIDWPLKAQFNEPSENFTTVTQGINGLTISMGFSLDRPEWRGYATLLPLYLIFALLGFSAFIRTDVDKLSHRIAIYAAIFASALAYSIPLQNTLPAGRYYLSIPETLVFGIICSAVAFTISTAIAYRHSISQVLADTIAAVVSQSFLSFLFLSFYFAKYVEIDSSQFLHIVSIQFTIMMLVFGGIGLLTMSDFIRNKEPNGSKELNQRLDQVYKGAFVISFFLEFASLSIVTYERIIQASFQVGAIREFIFSIAGNNVPLMIFLQVIFVIVYLSSLYCVVKKVPFSFVKDFFGFFLLFFSMFDFLSASILVYGDILAIFITSLLLAWLGALTFWIKRGQTLTDYERFVSWFDI